VRCRVTDPLHVIADDLTGACDVAAALLPWPAAITVHPDASGGRARTGDAATLTVRNTQSRTLPPAEATYRVRAALAPLGAAFRGIVLKKIDTGLRGSLGAEIDGAMDALGTTEAFVLPAIPEVGRTTVGGVQLIDGVPVHRTAFRDDPENPVRDACVARVIEATSCRRAAAVALDTVRRPGAVVECVDAGRAAGASIFVLDAETDTDLARAVAALLVRPRPLLLVGSIGLARALRRALPADSAPPPSSREHRAAGTGVLVVTGSAHPVARAQRVHAARCEGLTVLEVGPDADADAVAREAGALLARGCGVALTTPDTVVPGSERASVDVLRAVACGALAITRTRGLVLVGGETAFRVLDGLGHPRITIERRLGPLVVQGRLLDGEHEGLCVVTKGGSSGEEALLARLVAVLAGRAA
jgi:uncharacterized protein YgbK (DUF1537 family)